MGEWTDVFGITDGKAPKAKASAATAHPNRPETLAEQQSVVFHAKKAGMVCGAFVIEKNQKVAEIWRIGSIDEADVVLLKQIDGKDADEKRVTTIDLMKSWRVHKGAVTSVLVGWDPVSSPCDPSDYHQLRFDIAKGVIGMAVLKEWEARKSALHKIELLTRPACVKAKQQVAAGDLCLVGASARVDRKPGTGGNNILVGEFRIETGADACFITPHHTPPFNLAGDENKGAFVSPFWQVTKVDEPDKANMILVFVKHVVQEHTVNVPCLVNSRALAPGDMLTWYGSSKPKSVEDMTTIASLKPVDPTRRIWGKRAGSAVVKQPRKQARQNRKRTPCASRIAVRPEEKALR